VRELPAAELVAALVAETDDAVRRLGETSRSLASRP
jgi:hypothetical protein